MKDMENNDMELIKMISQGSKLKAVKLHMEQTGISLKEAKSYIDYLEGQYNSDFAQNGIEKADEEELIKMISQGNKINAIKYYKDRTGTNLKSAKNYIDQLENQIKANRKGFSQSEMQVNSEEIITRNESSPMGKIIGILFVILVILAGIYYFMVN